MMLVSRTLQDTFRFLISIDESCEQAWLGRRVVPVLLG